MAKLFSVAHFLRRILLICSILHLRNCFAEPTESARQIRSILSGIDVTDALSKLSTRQKIGQMFLPFMEPNLIPERDRFITYYNMGYGVTGTFPIWGIWSCKDWIKGVAELQQAFEKIKAPPMFIAMDAIHGAAFINDATVFPHSIGMAATWNTTLIQEVAFTTAKEMRICGLNWAYAPTADVALDPRWGRHYETFGDQPTLVSSIVSAVVRGLQSPLSRLGLDSLSNSSVPLVLATPKHWIAYSVPRGGVDRQMAYVPDWMMERYFIPPFREAMAEGIASVMLNSGPVNGLPGHAAPVLSQVLLRSALGWDGFLTSDWDDVAALVYRGGFFKTFPEATKAAVLAGLDVSMQSPAFIEALADLVQTAEVPVARIDEAASLVLKAKKLLGLFDSNLRAGFPDLANEVGGPESKRLAIQAIQESITLLQNKNNALPLRLDKPGKILVTGPAANSLTALTGAWFGGWQGPSSENDFRYGSTIFAALKELGSKNGWTVDFSQGCDYDSPTNTVDTVAQAANYDTIVIALGEKPYAEGAYNIADLELQAAQQNLADQLSGLGKKVILVLVQGRPRTFNRVVDKVDSILYTYLPGPYGGQALAEVIFGLVAPSGHLPFSYPIEAGALSSAYNSSATFRWTAGYGLTYTTFEFSDLTVDSSTFDFDPSKTLSIRVTVSNTGDAPGQALVTLWLKETFAYPDSIGVFMLKKFAKVYLVPGAKKTISFQFSNQDFRFVGATGEKKVDTEVRIADLAATFTVNYPNGKPSVDVKIPDRPADQHTTSGGPDPPYTAPVVRAPSQDASPASKSPDSGSPQGDVRRSPNQTSTASHRSEINVAAIIISIIISTVMYSIRTAGEYLQY